LKQAATRGPVFVEWMTQPAILNRLQQLLGPKIVCPLAHHNCIMTKQPAFSSDTGWHQDIRYWAFQRPELVNAWIALGQERLENGGLMVIPGSHRVKFTPEQFDASTFFRADLPQNQSLIEKRVIVELMPGDVLFFHCLTLHAATRNYTTTPKWSAVFTFRPADNLPVKGSRSASSPELALTPGD
jgi:phytanoyl-CoA hydroxylase